MRLFDVKTECDRRSLSRSNVNIKSLRLRTTTNVLTFFDYSKVIEQISSRTDHQARAAMGIVYILSRINRVDNTHLTYECKQNWSVVSLNSAKCSTQLHIHSWSHIVICFVLFSSFYSHGRIAFIFLHCFCVDSLYGCRFLYYDRLNYRINSLIICLVSFNFF